MKPWFLFLCMTIACWGLYVLTIHFAQTAIGGKQRALWAFMWVGVAYFLIAVIIPGAILYSQGELHKLPSSEGILKATGAGALGALGALGLILSIYSGGQPIYVAPLVFAGAPLVNTFATIMLHPPAKAPSPLFFIGIVLTAGGAAMVLLNKPAS